MGKITVKHCLFCGSKWTKKGRGVGFMINSVEFHIHNCKDNTPEQRVKNIMNILKIRKQRFETDEEATKKIGVKPHNSSDFSYNVNHDGISSSKNIELLRNYMQ